VIQFFLIVILALALIAAAAVIAAVIQGKRAKKALAERDALSGAFRQAEERARRLQRALGETAKTEAKADAERTDLARTSDGGLVKRANNLFVQNSGSGKSAGDAGSAAASGAGGSGGGAGGV
jgi:type II secretory pathway pseudopilin PulG